MRKQKLWPCAWLIPLRSSLDKGSKPHFAKLVLDLGKQQWRRRHKAWSRKRRLQTIACGGLLSYGSSQELISPSFKKFAIYQPNWAGPRPATHWIRSPASQLIPDLHHLLQRSKFSGRPYQILFLFEKKVVTFFFVVGTFWGMGTRLGTIL